MNPKYAVPVVIASLLLVVYSSSSNASAVFMVCGYVLAPNVHRCTFFYSDGSASIIDCTTHADGTRTCEKVAKTAIADLPAPIRDSLAGIARQEGETIVDAIPHKGAIDSKIPLAPK